MNNLDTAMTLNDCVSRCTSMAWDKGGIERVTEVAYTTVITWIKQVGEALPDAYEPAQTPQGMRT